MGGKGVGGVGLGREPGPEQHFHCGRSWRLRKFKQFVKSRPWWRRRGCSPPPHPNPGSSAGLREEPAMTGRLGHGSLCGFWLDDFQRH